VTDYDALLSLFDAADAAQKKAVEASKEWEVLANQVADELKGLKGHASVCSGELRFEKDRFSILCNGTGIYSHEQWWEDFPIEPLLKKALAQKR
jgi:hypothetical protein